MPHPPEHKAVIDAVIDSELAVTELVKAALESSKDASQRAQKLLASITSQVYAGKLAIQKAKALWVQGFRLLVLAQYIQQIEPIQKAVDEHTAHMISEAKKLGPELKKVGAIRDGDIMARELEKKGGLNGGSDPGTTT